MPASRISFKNALPFWLSLGLLPLIFIGAKYGGWLLWLAPLYAWALTSVLDVLLGIDETNPDPNIDDRHLFWYRLITLIWFPLQFITIYAAIWWAAQGHLSGYEQLGLFFGIGVMSGTIGIVYSHELMHQKNNLERWLADLLLATVLYSHFRSEHLLVHHRYVGTPRDAVTAPYNQGFHRFFWNVLRKCPVSALQAERDKLARAGRSPWHGSNPFWRYGALQLATLTLAWLIGGWPGVGLFAFQALIAVWQLELTNYIEHYGLVRRKLPDGRYEPVRPCHSWNAPHKASNWLLINLQRHSDHHTKPARRFPLLQTYGIDEAPMLPIGYPALGMVAMIPPLWRRRMNPKVRAWRKTYYPDITDWKAPA